MLPSATQKCYTGGMTALSFHLPKLTHRKGCRTYSVRLRVPADLAAVYAPKTEFTKSFKTTDYKEALSQQMVWAVKLDQEFTEHRRRLAAMQAGRYDNGCHTLTTTASRCPAPAVLRPFADMPDYERDRLLLLYPEESLKEATARLNTPPPEDEAQARREWQEEQELLRELDSSRTGKAAATVGKTPPAFLPASKAYKEKLKGDARLFLEAAPLCLQDGDISPILSTATAFLERHGYKLPLPFEEDASPEASKARREFQTFCLELLQREVDVQRLFLGKLDGEPSAMLQGRSIISTTLTTTATAAQAATVAQSLADTVEGPDNPKFSAVFERSAEEKGDGLAPSSRKDYERAVQWFIDLNGDLPIRAIRTRDHVIRFKDALLSRVYRGKHLSPRTVLDKYLAAIKSVFSYAKANGLRDDNPAGGIRVADNKASFEKEVTRLPFTNDELLKLFETSRLYHKNGSIGDVGKIYSRQYKQNLTDYRWFILLALYTGARIEELGQLDRNDVQQNHGVWHIHIHGDTATGRRVKNAASVRKVPLHDKLLSLGFLKFAGKTEEGGATQGQSQAGKLFASFPKRQDGKRTNAFSQWFQRFLKTLPIEDREKKSFHSFRHTFKREGRNTEGVPPEILDALQGHAQQGTAAQYGRDEDGQRYALPVLKAALDKMTFGNVTDCLKPEDLVPPTP